MSAPNQPQNVMRYAGLATQWLVVLLIAAWAGFKLDQKIKWRVPVCTILLPLGSLVLLLWQVIKEFSKPKK
jgi:hypothetical protein